MPQAVPHKSQVSVMIATSGWRIGLAAVVMAMGSCPTAGQDLVLVAPESAKVEYQDAHVRIVRLRIPDHATLPMHDRPGRVVVSLTANDVRLTRADGTTSETHTEAGSVAWSGPTVRSVQNLGGRLENVVVELKQADSPAKSVVAPPEVPPKDYLSEPRHKWTVENQYVRVYDVRIPPGATTDFHRHAFDQVAIFVSGGLVSDQMEGQQWGLPERIEPGFVEFSADAVKPMTHRVRNDGNSEYRVVLVQFLRQ